MCIQHSASRICRHKTEEKEKRLRGEGVSGGAFVEARRVEAALHADFVSHWYGRGPATTEINRRACCAIRLVSGQSLLLLLLRDQMHTPLILPMCIRPMCVRLTVQVLKVRLSEWRAFGFLVSRLVIAGRCFAEIYTLSVYFKSDGEVEEFFRGRRKVVSDLVKELFIKFWGTFNTRTTTPVKLAGFIILS